MKNLSLNEMEKVSGGDVSWNGVACGAGFLVMGALAAPSFGLSLALGVVGLAACTAGDAWGWDN